MPLILREARLVHVCLGLAVGSFIAWTLAAIPYLLGVRLPG